MSWDDTDIFALAMLSHLGGRYLPWGTYGMRPSALAAILHEVTHHERKTILECGQGVSTVYLARELAASGGHLYTIEHDPAWRALVQRLLEREELGGYVTSILAPLEPDSRDGSADRWYSRAVVERHLAGAEVDLLIVDGPPAGAAAPEARYPALPFLFPYLGAAAVVMLDDADRRGEQRVIDRWETELGLSFSTQGLGRIARACRAGRSDAVMLPFADARLAAHGTDTAAQAARDARKAISIARKATVKLAKRVEKVDARTRALDRRMQSLESPRWQRALLTVAQRARRRG